MIFHCPVLKSQHLPVIGTGERITVFTDRTLYVSGEKVFFSATIFNVKEGTASEYSRTLYCELITPDGTRIIGRKYPVNNSSGQGCITIPEETVSGIYYLKFYTRFMRNSSTGEYKYLMLKIINPFKTEVLSGNVVFDTTLLAMKTPEGHAANQSLEIMAEKKSFSPRQEIQLTLRCKTAVGTPSRLCLSVIPESTFEQSFSPETNHLNAPQKGLYLPETRGISLSGQLIEKDSGQAIPYAKVNLSIIGDKDVLVVRSDSSGKFCFALPEYTGTKDIFLCADDLPDIIPEILIDNDFCSRPVSLPWPRFTLNEDEMKAAYKLAVNFRVSSTFNSDTLAREAPADKNNTSFYGVPSEILVMAKFIDLPTLSEYFTQLPGIARLKTIQGRKQFRFYTSQEEMAYHDPLLLVDWVAVNDVKKILAMPPPEIDRIELVNAIYIKGNVMYGGIISFVSKKNDFAGIDLPTSGKFVNYRFLEECTENITATPPTENIPDPRNTIYWNPAVLMKDDGTAGISFPAPDTPGKYWALLRQTGNTGEVTETKEMFVVTGK